MTKPVTALDRLNGDLDSLRDPAAQFSDGIWLQNSPAGDAPAYAPENFSFAAVVHSQIVQDVAAISSSSHASLQSGGDHQAAANHASAGLQLPAFEPTQPAYVPTGGSGTTEGTSPSMAAEVAFMSGINADGTVAGTSFWTWNQNTPAGYGSSSNVHKWGAATAGTPGGTIDYYFTPASDWTTTEKNVFTACLTLWSDVANIHFALTTSAGDAQLTFTRAAPGDGAEDNGGWSGNGSSGTIGGTALWSMTNSTVSIDTTENGFGPIDGSFSSFGGYVWLTILHELGHAIGLGHTGPYNEGTTGSDPDSSQFSAYDMRLWSVMSYIDPGDSAAYSSQYPVTGTSWGTTKTGGFIYDDVPTTLMPLDIMAAQGLYGVSAAAAYSGGQTFGFNCNITDVTKEFYDFTVNTKPVVTLWDAGTGNTLNLSGFTAPATIDLNPGTFSSCDGMVNNIGIAFNTKIDNAVGGHGNDTFIANGDADHLNGGAGNDTFDFGATFTSADHVNGSTGSNNILDLDGDYSTNVAFGSSTMVNIQKLVLQSGHSYFLTPSDNNVAAGKSLTVDAHTLKAANTLTFNGVKELDGSFVIRGGAGNDDLVGGSGNDTITGGAGADKLKGGPGDDVFVYAKVSESTSTGHDIIQDFDASADKIDLWFTIAGISTAITTGTLSSGSFDANLAAAVSTLASHHAVLFTPNAGNLSGHTFLVVDVNGTAGYQAGADLVIDLDHPTHIGSFGTGNFI